MIIHPRSAWSPKHGRGNATAPGSRMSRVVIHHAPERGLPAQPTPAQVAEQIQIMEDWHAKTLTPTNKRIGYQWIVVAQTGDIWEGLGWDRIGAHVGGHNTASLGVLVLGIDGRTSNGGSLAWRAIAWLVQEGVRRGSLVQRPELAPHNRYVATTCPGGVLTTYVEGLTLERLADHLAVPAPGVYRPDQVEPRPPEVVIPITAAPDHRSAINLDYVVVPTPAHIDEIARVRRLTADDVRAGVLLVERLGRGVLAAHGSAEARALKWLIDALADWDKRPDRAA